MSTETHSAQAWGMDHGAEREAEILLRLGSLQAKNPRLRAEAARRLGELRAGTEALLEALNDISAQVRSAAAEALGAAGEEAGQSLRSEVIDSLMAAIDDSNDYVCSAAIHSLGRLKAQESREELLVCLQDSNPHITEAAILALARIGPPDIAIRLLPFLTSSNDYLQSAAARAMGILGYTGAVPQLIANLKASLEHVGRPRNEYLIGSFILALDRLLAREAIPLLVQIAQTEVGLRSKAVQALINLQAEEAVPLLMGMFADPGSRLRASLLRLVVQTGYQPALPAVRPLLEDANSQVRQSALEAVIRMKDRASLERVRQICFSDTNPYLRVKAVHGLTGLAGEQALPDLLALAEDPNTYVRLAAVTGLEAYPALPASACPVLARLASSDPVVEVACAAKKILDGAKFSDAGGEIFPEEPALPLPPGLRTEAPRLADLLQRWQDGLAGLSPALPPEELLCLDSALTELLRAIRRT